MDTQSIPARSLDTLAYRACVGEFATGVTVVTAEHGDTAAGMTLNSFTSISLNPLLVLISLSHGARTLEAILGSGTFAVNILHRHQSEAAMAFARRGAPFPREHVTRDRNGFLSIPGSAGVLWCRVANVITAGDHDLILGEVFDFIHPGGEPLIFHRGTLGGLQPDSHMPFDHPIGLMEGAGW